MKKIVYRFKQFYWSWTAGPLSDAQQAQVETVLVSAELINLFYTQSYDEQQHTMRILDLLRQANHHHPSLHKAALLHDLGKTRFSLSILDRVLIVLASRIIPQRARRWGDDPNPPYRHRKAFVIRRWHPMWGAEMVANSDLDQLSINLIRRHQDKLNGSTVEETEEEQLLRQLQWADDQS